MPHLLVLVLAGAGLYAGYRWFTRESERVAGDLKRAEAELKRQANGDPGTKDLGRLKLDRKSGEYRPDRKGPDV
jgi:hypothetical protein